MADENNDANQKSRVIGTLPIAKLQKLAEFKSWQSCSESFSRAKEASAEAKQKFRDALRKGAPALKDVEHLEFGVHGSSLQIFEKRPRERSRRTGTNELQFK